MPRYPMAESSEAQTVTIRITLLAGMLLILARFVRYIDVVTDTDVGAAATMAWWGTYLAGIGLLTYGALDHLGDRDPEEGLAAWGALLVGLILLTVMPASPAGLTVNVGGFMGP